MKNLLIGTKWQNESSAIIFTKTFVLSYLGFRASMALNILPTLLFPIIGLLC